tara:strand:+ start:179 stop:517 length:339 start_codon:yes stop_codon:yes gene_type:complete
MPKQLFKPQTFNCELTESQISTILYVLEGYSQGNDDEELVQEMDEIFKVLENVVPQDYYDAVDDGVVVDKEDWTNNVNPPLTTAEYNKIKESVELENVTDEWYDEEGNLKHD